MPRARRLSSVGEEQKAPLSALALRRRATQLALDALIKVLLRMADKTVKVVVA